jgi:hypothetical protein
VLRSRGRKKRRLLCQPPLWSALVLYIYIQLPLWFYSRLPEARGRACAQASGASYASSLSGSICTYASCRSDSIYILCRRKSAIAKICSSLASLIGGTLTRAQIRTV